MQKEEIPTVQEQTVTDQEEIIMTAQVQATEDRTDRTVREDLRVKEDPREDVLAREETRAKETVREDLRAREDPREITAREDVSDREDPRAMVRAVRGKIDLIITKEITRFARNVLDSIRYTRELLDCGTAVWFRNDNINTLDEDSELRLSIMSEV